MLDKNKRSNRILLRFEILGFAIWRSLVAFGRGFVLTFAPAVDRKAGGGFSFVARVIFGIVTLEGPRLMLISRHRAAHMKTGTKVGISAVSGVAVASIILATIVIGSQIIAVTVNGQIIGYVENEEQYNSLLQRAKAIVSEQVGAETSDIIIQDTGVSLETILAPQLQQPLQAVLAPAEAPLEEVGGPGGAAALEVSRPAVNVPAETDASTASATPVEALPNAAADEEGEEALLESLIDSLLNESAIKGTLYSITINDEVMATLATMKEARDVLKAIADNYMPDDGDSPGRFIDNVTIDSVTTELDEIDAQKPEEVIAYLLAGKLETRIYTAVEDDSVENIINSLGVSARALRTAYADYDFSDIQEGTTFVMTVNIPYIHYETEGMEETIKPIPFETIEERSLELYLGQREIKVQGETGELSVMSFVTRVNGEVVSRIETGSEVILAPKDEIVLVGTQLVGGNAYVGPSDGFGGGGDGVLGRPLDSWYLTRSVGNGHNGSDMVAPRGSPIYAAAWGHVTYSGYYGSYGNLVIVNHGEGLQTYYAHCDTLNVTVGQQVDRGQQIATVGTTGRSTAYHLHFEVRVNGAVMEPFDWIA